MLMAHFGNGSAPAGVKRAVRAMSHIPGRAGPEIVRHLKRPSQTYEVKRKKRKEKEGKTKETRRKQTV